MITHGCTAEEITLIPNLKLLGVPMAGLNTLPMELLRERSGSGDQRARQRTLGCRTGNCPAVICLRANRVRRPGPSTRTVARLRCGRAGSTQLAFPLGYDGGNRRNRFNRSVDRPVSAFVWFPDYRCATPGRHRRHSDGLFDEVGTDLDGAFDSADAVIVTLPSTPETVGIIGPTQFKLLEPGILVNVGRGDVIDESALYRAVAGGRVSCGIDTWFSYPDPPGARHMPSRYPLEQFDNVVMSPHLGGYNVQATTASGKDIAERIAAWVEAGQPSHVDGAVDLEAGY